MKTIALACLVIALATGVGWASLVRVPPYPRVFASADGRLGAVVRPAEKAARVRVFALKEDGTEQDLREGALICVPGTVMVMDDQAVREYLVTLDVWGDVTKGEHGVVIYDARGQVLADYEARRLFPDLKASTDDLSWWRQGATVTVKPTNVSTEGPHLQITLKDGQTVTITIKTGQVTQATK